MGSSDTRHNVKCNLLSTYYAVSYNGGSFKSKSSRIKKIVQNKSYQVIFEQMLERDQGVFSKLCYLGVPLF